MKLSVDPMLYALAAWALRAARPDDHGRWFTFYAADSRLKFVLEDERKRK